MSADGTDLPPHLEEIRARVSNWGRWGADDERGTANLLTAESTGRGAAAVRSGQRVPLAVELREDGVQVGQPANRTNPVLEMEIINGRDPMAPGFWVGSDDRITMTTCAGTHLDALCHMTYDGFMYNGFPASAITEAGTSRCGAETLPAIATRGILLDLPRVHGVDGLDEVAPGYAVTPDDLEAALDAAGLAVEPGDALLVRTGEMRHYRAGHRQRYATGDAFRLPGIGLGCVEWFRRHDVAVVVTDSYAYEAFPPPSPDWSDIMCVHLLQLRDVGLLQGQNWDLEDLAVACADDERWDLLLVAVPEPIRGATSAPVAPVAIR